jgi:WD40 repeat protein
MWNIPSGTFLQVFSGHNSSVTQGQFSPDGKLVVTAGEDGALIVFDPKTGQALKKMTSEDGRWHSGAIVSMSMNGENMLLSGSEDGSARLTHIAQGRILASLDHKPSADEEGESVEAVAFVPIAGLHICATGSLDGSIKFWDTSNLRLRHSVADAHPAGVIKIVACKTQPWIVSCGNDGQVKVWDARHGTLLKAMTGHGDIVLDLDVSRYWF